MVIDDIHDDIDVGFLVVENHFLEFLDTVIAIIWIRRIRTFKAVVVKWVITPVEGWIYFIVGLIKNRLKLKSVDTELFNMIKTGLDGLSIFRIGGIFFT